MSWPLIAIEDFATVKGGKRLPKGHDFQASPTDHPYIRARDIGAGRVQIAEPVYLDENTFRSISKYTVSEGDIIVTIVGANIGDVGFVTNEFSGANLTENAAKITVDPSKVSSKFLKFALANSHTKTKFQYIASGAAQGKLGLFKIKSFQVSLPPISIQEKIGNILASYDDLIENNRRRIQLLEESARLLYKEWFVQLRFPGHEHVKVVDGVPEGWNLGVASDVLDIMSGGTPKTKVQQYWDGNIPFFTPKDATDSPFVLTTEKSLTEEGLKKCNSKLYPPQTVFITARGTVGKLNLNLVPMAMNQSCYALKVKSPLNQIFLYCAMEASIAQVKARASGAVFDAIVVNTFNLIPFMTPSVSIIEEFTSFVGPVFNQIGTLMIQNKKLIEARDILLPRLMNGALTA